MSDVAYQPPRGIGWMQMQLMIEYIIFLLTDRSERRANMAKIQVIGDACVITSTATMEGIKKLEKHCPDALKIYDENDNVVFKVSSTTGEGSVSKYGISFNSTSRTEGGFATVTLNIADVDGDIKDYIADKYGIAITRLTELEDSMDDAISEVDRNIAAIKANITVA